MKNLYSLFLLILMPALLFILNSSFDTLPENEKIQSHKITFKIKNAGITVDGSFSDFKAEIRFDPKDPPNNRLQASVSVASVDTGIKMRDRDLQEEKYFYTDKFPRITLTSKRINHLGKDQYKGTFDLRIRDITKEIEIPFVFSRVGELGTFKGNFEIDRRDYGVGSNSMILSDDVRVFIEVATIK